MGINQSYLKKERFIEVDPQITIGICGEKKGINPLGAQCLRIYDDSELYSLQFYQKTENCLCFEFEQNIKLYFMKQNNGTIVYNFKTPDTSRTKTMDKKLIRIFKPIHFLSNEFDLIYDFIREKDKEV